MQQTERWGEEGNDAAYSSGGALEPASPGQRLLGRLIDAALSVVVLLLCLLASGIISGSDSTDGAAESAAGFLNPYAVMAWALLMGVYEVVFTALGATLGKKLIGTRVISFDDGDDPGVGSAVRRWGTQIVCGFVPFAPLVMYASLLWHKDRRTWYDLAAGTLVVRDR